MKLAYIRSSHLGNKHGILMSCLKYNFTSLNKHRSKLM